MGSDLGITLWQGTIKEIGFDATADATALVASLLPARRAKSE